MLPSLKHILWLWVPNIQRRGHYNDICRYISYLRIFWDKFQWLVLSVMDPMQGLSGKLKVFIRLDSVLRRSVATTYASFLIMETFLNATSYKLHVTQHEKTVLMCQPLLPLSTSIKLSTLLGLRMCICSYAVCQFNQASFYYLVLLASLTRPWQTLYFWGVAYQLKIIEVMHKVWLLAITLFFSVIYLGLSCYEWLRAGALYGTLYLTHDVVLGLR